MDSDRLRAWVLDSLRRGWSPELIEGRLKARYAGDPSMRISHECLYQWIYAKPQRALDLRQYLARGRKRRTRKKGRKAKGPRIPMRAPIADRPEAVGSRKGFGHFESDTVLLQCLFDRFGSVFPQCGLMVFPGVVIVSR